MYANKVDAHQARKAAESLDKAPKAEAKTFAQALSSGEPTSTSTTKPKGKATNKPEKANQFCNILNLPGSITKKIKASTLVAHAKFQFGLDLTEVSFLVPPNKNNKYFFWSVFIKTTFLETT